MFVRVVGTIILVLIRVKTSLYVCKFCYFIIRIMRWALFDVMRFDTRVVSGARSRSANVGN
jgi:hypothetical protein